MSSTTAPNITGTRCGTVKTHGCFCSGTTIGDMQICGILFSTATSTTARHVGVDVEATRRSILSSPISLRAFLTALEGSPASSNRMYLTGCPATISGKCAKIFQYGIPAEAVGPVVPSVIPIVISACADDTAAITTAPTTVSLNGNFMRTSFCG